MVSSAITPTRTIAILIGVAVIAVAGFAVVRSGVFEPDAVRGAIPGPGSSSPSASIVCATESFGFADTDGRAQADDAGADQGEEHRRREGATRGVLRDDSGCGERRVQGLEREARPLLGAPGHLAPACDVVRGLGCAGPDAQRVPQLSSRCSWPNTSIRQRAGSKKSRSKPALTLAKSGPSQSPATRSSEQRGRQIATCSTT